MIPDPCPVAVYPWWHLHPDVGWFIVIFGLVGVLVPLVREKIEKREKAFWTFVLVLFAFLELRTIHYDGLEHEDTENHDRCVQLHSFQKIADGIKQELDITSQILDLQKLSRAPNITPAQESSLIKRWGQVSQSQTKAVQGAVVSQEQPAKIQQGKRFVDAEALGKALREGEHSAATVINDGTYEAGSLANQLVVGLIDAGWQAGGNNIKMGDPDFFPDSLTIEVSSTPASSEDHSISEGKELREALNKQGVEANLRFTTLAFPPNFMRIKVRGQ